MTKQIKNFTNEFNIFELKKYLKKHPKLSEKETQQINKKIEKMTKANKNMWNKWLNSELCKLAKIQLKREGKAQPFKLGETTVYHVDPIENFLKASEILKKADKRKIKI